jgi:hypothetical protein
MHPLRTAGLAALLLLPGAASATDLKKIDRTITKEPVYASKQPRYCLLVFGPEATTRVWLVVDGDFLYIDRNGNGDLTEPGERVRFAGFRAVAPGEVAPGEVAQGAFAAERDVDAGDILEGKLKHEHLVVTQERVRPKFAAKEPWEEELQAVAAKGPETLVYQLRLTLEIRPRPGDPIRIACRISQYAGMDGAGFLQFADRPEDAPIVHFRGPMTMGLHSPQRLVLGSEKCELLTVVGSPGMGKGTFASVGYDGLITAGAAPVAEIAFPSPAAGSLPPARYVLPHRC